MIEGNGYGKLFITECPLCGAERGEDYTHFSRHVREEHDAADVGLEDDRVRADGGETETVYVVSAGRGYGGSRNRVHLDVQCDRLQRAENYYERERGPWHDDQICSFCSGEADTFEGKPGVDANATRRKLLETDPDEVGQS